MFKLTIVCFMGLIFLFAGCGSNKSGFNIEYHDSVSIKNGLLLGEIVLSDLGDCVNVYESEKGDSISTYQKENIYTVVMVFHDGDVEVSQTRIATDIDYGSYYRQYK